MLQIIDNKTLALVAVLVAVLNTLALAYFTGRRPRFKGQRHWVLGSGLYTLGVCGLLLQGQVDKFITVVLGNTVLVGSLAIILVGLELFVYGKSRRNLVAVYPLVSLIGIAWLTYIHFNTPMRIMLFSLLLGLIGIHSGFTLLNWKNRPHPPRYWGGAFVYFFFASFFLFRAVVTMAQPTAQSIFSINAFNSLAFIMGIFANICWTMTFISLVTVRTDQERLVLIDELQQALSEVKKLEGFIPICSNCKKIRDDQGYWQQVEQYVSERSSAQFSHGICPDCIKILYPDYDIDKND
jgi:hypothetical protein